ncbi:MAG: RDD family protein [Sphingobium sp.]|nr:RDD family protein [Sphingobium sp.]
MARADRRLRDMRRSLVTPEGVDLGIVLAEASARAAAFVVDAMIMLVTMIIVTIALAFGALAYATSGGELILIGWLLFFFLMRNFYFILFEGGRRAATPGKRLNNLRVISRDGSGLSIDQIIARNLMREIEVFLPLTLLASRAASGTADALTSLFGLGWALLFTFFPLFNRDRLRIGDLLAGTAVIYAPRRRLLDDLVAAAPPETARFRFTDAQFDAYGIAELQRLEQVLRDGNEQAWWTVARAIEGRIGWTGRLDDPRAFLTAYYEGLRAHLEREVLFGVRRADKNAR